MKSELMKELFSKMLESNELIENIEHNFGRYLTDEERALVLTKGSVALFDKLGLSEEDYNTMIRAVSLISAGFTESSDRYDYELEQNNYKALDLFKSLVNDLECVEAERRKVKIGKKEDLGSHITVSGENCGYKEENDKELDELFKDAKISENPDKTFAVEDTYKDPDLNKVFASATKCDAMHITGDTYNEDEDPDCKESWGPGHKYTISNDESNKLEFDKKVEQAIARLDKGCELELDDETIDAIVEKLWKERDNVSIKIHNNKISLQ